MNLILYGQSNGFHKNLGIGIMRLHLWYAGLCINLSRFVFSCVTDGGETLR